MLICTACGSSDADDATSEAGNVKAAAGGSAAVAAGAKAMSPDVCRKADMLIDSCQIGGWNNMADDNYLCKSLKDKCRSECIVSRAKTCDEFKSGTTTVSATENGQSSLASEPAIKDRGSGGTRSTKGTLRRWMTLPDSSRETTIQLVKDLRLWSLRRWPEAPHKQGM